MPINDKQIESVHKALDQFYLQMLSWGFGDTGTRFGKFLRKAAAA